MNRFHYHNRHIILSQDFILLFCGSLIPVIIVKLYLYKIPAVCFQQSAQAIRRTVKRKSEMPDLSLFLLLLKIRNAAAAFIVGGRGPSDL